MIDFDRLTLERLSFEVRYNGPFFLDRCGLIWKEIEGKFPEIVAIGIQPDGATFALNAQAITLKFNALSLNVHVEYPTSIITFAEITDFLVSRIVERLELQVFSRIGARFVYLLKVTDMKEADTLLLSSTLVGLPTDRIQLFGKEASAIATKFNLQDEDQGYTFNIGTVSRELQSNVPRPFVIDESRFAKNGLAIDIDKFTRKPVGVGVASASEFIRAGQKTISNNLGALLRPEK
jgi:hypothetical protein